MDLRRGHHRCVPDTVLLRTHVGLPAKVPLMAFFVDFISGSRCLALFFVEDGAEIIGASTIVLVLMIRPCTLR